MKTTSFQEIKQALVALKDNPKAVMAIAGVILFLDATILLRGQFLSVIGMFARANRLKQSIVTTREDTKLVETYKNKVGDEKTRLAVLNKMAVAEEDLPNVMETISKFADLSSVRILKIRPIFEVKAAQGSAKAPAKIEGFARQKISISAVSGFHQMGRFIALLENSGIFFDIKSVEIRTDEQEYMKQAVTIVLEAVLRKS